MIQIKTCPMCRGRGKLIDESGSWGYYPATAYVKCAECGTEGPTVNDDAYPEYKSEAIRLWNKRVAGD